MAKTQLDRIEEKVDALLKWVYGNGRLGAQVRIDRLEGKWRLVQWIVGIGAAVVVAMMGAVIRVWIGEP